ncbi:MAG: c-type cytochrome [Methylococcaceae bacterium]|nr:c-type cytochrome [Methylococcaceae bacterium]
MKTILTIIGTAVVGLSIYTPALAADAAAGKKIFMNSCVGCHNKGLNVIAPTKTLKKSDLEKNGMYSVKAIINQVTNGKSPMPAFASQLSSSDIENVAEFVLQQANADWK